MKKGSDGQSGGRPKLIKELLPFKLTPVKERLLSFSDHEEEDGILFQHTVFCQTGLPYRNLGDDVTSWERRNGSVVLRVEAGSAYDPSTERFEQLGLPFGPKPRLILAHLNTEALLSGKPEIEVGSSLTGFAKQIYSTDPNGRELRTLKTQLGRLGAAQVRLALVKDGRAAQVQTNIVSAFDLWFPKDQRQRVLWPSVIRLSADYFHSLQAHAVPLSANALAALAHSAMGLDIYAWLAQRLHRVSPEKPALVPWQSLYEQFGPNYAQIFNFRREFKLTLRQVKVVYREARIEADEKGLWLRNSPPPILKRMTLTSGR